VDDEGRNADGAQLLVGKRGVSPSWRPFRAEASPPAPDRGRRVPPELPAEREVVEDVKIDRGPDENEARERRAARRRPRDVVAAEREADGEDSAAALGEPARRRIRLPPLLAPPREPAR